MAMMPAASAMARAATVRVRVMTFFLLAVFALARHRLLGIGDDDSRGPGCKHEGQGREHHDLSHVPLSRWVALYQWCRSSSTFLSAA
jgi:hypothetical protein